MFTVRYYFKSVECFCLGRTCSILVIFGMKFGKYKKAENREKKVMKLVKSGKWNTDFHSERQR